MLTISFHIHTEGAIMEIHDPAVKIHALKAVNRKHTDSIMETIVKATGKIGSFMGQEAELFIANAKPKRKPKRKGKK